MENGKCSQKTFRLTMKFWSLEVLFMCLYSNSWQSFLWREQSTNDGSLKCGINDNIHTFISFFPKFTASLRNTSEYENNLIWFGIVLLLWKNIWSYQKSNKPCKRFCYYSSMGAFVNNVTVGLKIFYHLLHLSWLKLLKIFWRQCILRLYQVLSIQEFHIIGEYPLFNFSGSTVDSLKPGCSKLTIFFNLETRFPQNHYKNSRNLQKLI